MNLSTRKFILFAIFLALILIAPLIPTSKAATPPTPTIHAKATGGNWSYFGMWEEERVPGPTDIVEINGNVTLNTNADIAGLIVNNGAVLKPRQMSSNPRFFNLNVSGDVFNNGTIKDEFSNTSFYGDLILNASGNLENTGSLESKNLNVVDFTNSGTFSSANLKISGNLSNTGTVTAGSYIETAGTVPQQVTSSTPLGFLFIKNNTTVSGNLTMEGRLSVDSGFTLNFGSQNTLTANSFVANNGEIAGGNFVMGGTDQNLFSSGVFNVNKLTFGGTGIKTMKEDNAINGDMEVLSGVTLQPFRSPLKPTYTLSVGGDVTNNGTIQDNIFNTSLYGKLNIVLTGSLTNFGTITNNDILLAWAQNTLADYYEIRFTDANLNWLNPAIVNTFTISIKNQVNDNNAIWQARPIISTFPGNWTTPYAINGSAHLIPELTITDVSGLDIASGTPIDFGQITLETPLQKTFTLSNAGFRDLSISNLSLTGAANFSLQSLDGNSLTLAPGASHTFGIHFTAFAGEASGNRQASFSFSSNDNDESSFALTIIGEVLMPNPAPVLTEITPIPAITQDKTPDYTFHSTEAGTLNYEGPCSSPVTQINEGNTTITFNLLASGYYDYCFLTVTDIDGNSSDPLTINPFTVNQVMFESITWDQVIDELILWRAFHEGRFSSEEKRLKKLEKYMGKYTKAVNKGKYPQAAQKARKAISAGYNDIPGIVNELKALMPDKLDRLKRILIKKPMKKMYGNPDDDDSSDDDSSDDHN